MAENRKEFSKNLNQPKSFNTLINPKKKKVTIAGENNFSNNSLVPPTTPNKKVENNKRGRPIEITDERYKVIKPKKISPALESKLNVLQDYITELQTETGRITFEKLINTLADSYIHSKLSISKEEHILKEIKENFEKIK